MVLTLPTSRGLALRNGLSPEPGRDASEVRLGWLKLSLGDPVGWMPGPADLGCGKEVGSPSYRKSKKLGKTQRPLAREEEETGTVESG